MSLQISMSPDDAHLFAIRSVSMEALRCFFHVYEEAVGRYGMRLQRHVLSTPGYVNARGLQRPPRAGCDRVLDPHDCVRTARIIRLDRTWCRTCADLVREYATRRGGQVIDPA